MRKKSLRFFFLLYLLVSSLFFFNTVEAQNGIALSKKKSRQSQDKLSAVNSSQQKQKLFNALRDLNQTKGIYFLFSDKTFGDILVDPVADTKGTAEELLDALLRETDLAFKKINTKNISHIIAQGSGEEKSYW